MKSADKNRFIKSILFFGILVSMSISPARADSVFIDLDETGAVEQMLAEVNRLRANVDLPPLILDPVLSDVCRGHSKDMAEMDFFGHYDPYGLDANGRVRKAGLNCIVAENIGVYRTNDTSLESIIVDLMDSFYKSESHRNNILNPDYTHIGIGFYQDEDTHSSIFDSELDDGGQSPYGVVFVTQDFYRREISETHPASLPGLVGVGEELTLNIVTVDEFDTLSLQFEREGFFTEEYWVPASPNAPNIYSCRVIFAEEGLWACRVIAVYDSLKGLTRAIGQMEFEVR